MRKRSMRNLSAAAKMQLIEELLQAPERLEDGLLIEVSGGLITKEEALKLTPTGAGKLIELLLLEGEKNWIYNDLVINREDA